jgi:hypothetical protein
MIAPDKDFSMIVLQNPSNDVQTEGHWLDL